MDGRFLQNVSYRRGYVWQAGFVLVFDGSGCPKYEKKDPVFLERMLIVPMRARSSLRSISPLQRHAAAVKQAMRARTDAWFA